MTGGAEVEYLDIVDGDGKPVGGTVSRADAHALGVRHRTAHVWVARKRAGGYDVLLQKRSMEKGSFPGMYDTSSAGHIPAGDEPLPSALRELREELGLEARPEDLGFAGIFRNRYERVFHGKLFRDDEVIWVYVYRGTADEKRLTLQKSEVDEVRWFGLEEALQEVKNGSSTLCVPERGLLLLKGYLEREERG